MPAGESTIVRFRPSGHSHPALRTVSHPLASIHGRLCCRIAGARTAASLPAIGSPVQSRSRADRRRAAGLRQSGGDQIAPDLRFVAGDGGKRR